MNPMHNPPTNERTVLLVITEDIFVSGMYDRAEGWYEFNVTDDIGQIVSYPMRATLEPLGWIDPPTVDMTSLFKPNIESQVTP